VEFDPHFDSMTPVDSGLTPTVDLSMVPPGRTYEFGLQFTGDTERPAALQAIANRLSPWGIFFSQCHDGGWKPPAKPQHATRAWFEAMGWHLWQSGSPLTGRVAWLLTTTG
jgi:hypothetical protein